MRDDIYVVVYRLSIAALEWILVSWPSNISIPITYFFSHQHRCLWRDIDTKPPVRKLKKGNKLKETRERDIKGHWGREIMENGE